MYAVFRTAMCAVAGFALVASACAPTVHPVTRQANGLLAVGSGLPRLSGVALDGTVITNETLHGKTVLLNTWFVG